MSDDAPFMVVGGRGGRPPRAGVRSKARIEFVVTEYERSALQKVAAENRMSLASVIREAVNTFVQDYSERVVFLPSGDKFK